MNTLLETKVRALKIWFEEKIFLITMSFLHDFQRKLVCRMGDVYFMKIGVNIGDEIDKHRPVLIFQGQDWYIKNSRMVLAIPITSNTTKKKYGVTFGSNDIESGSLSTGTILVQQVRALSKVRLQRKIARFKIHKLIEVRGVFEKFLYKNTPLEREATGGKTIV